VPSVPASLVFAPGSGHLTRICQSVPTPQITGLLRVLADEHQRQHFYLGRIQTWSEDGRTGPEFDDPDRGQFLLEEIALTAEALDAISLEPDDIAALLRNAVTTGTDLATLADPTR